MHCLLRRTHVISAALGLLLVLSSSAALAQYQLTYLTSDLTGKAKLYGSAAEECLGTRLQSECPVLDQR